MMAAVDPDGDDAIEFPEFLTLMSWSFTNSDHLAELVQAFAVFDRDETGFVDVSEARHIVTSLGCEPRRDAGLSVDDMIEHATDSRHRVDYTILAGLLTSDVKPPFTRFDRWGDVAYAA